MHKGFPNGNVAGSAPLTRAKQVQPKAVADRCGSNRATAVSVTGIVIWNRNRPERSANAGGADAMSGIEINSADTLHLFESNLGGPR